MVTFRRWMILIHRYLGIALSLLFVVWFASAIPMIYAGGMPRLTAETRMQRLPSIDFSRIRRMPAEAAEDASLGREPTRLTVLTVLDRPAYRFLVDQTPVTIFADNGELLDDVTPDAALSIASRFMNLPEAKLHHLGVLQRADQWTIGERRRMPLHKIAVDDAARTELYVSEPFGEVVLETTRGTRALAWVAAIPHWLYFAPLRTNDALWRQVVLWTSGLGTISALIGLTLAITQYRSRYAGWLRWHYIAGVAFGVVTLTWVFSGLLSMEPWFWASGGGTGDGVREALSGGPLDPSLFPAFEPDRWRTALDGRAPKEIDFVRVQGDPYYVLGDDRSTPRLVAARSLAPKAPFSIDSLTDRVKAATAGVPVAAIDVLSAYDSYYHARDRQAALPVLRIKFDDPDGTWFYIDPAMGQAVARFTRRERLQRWLFNGLHSLDFSFWYNSRPLWDVVMIALCLGGTALSVIGVLIGYKRVTRTMSRIRPPTAGGFPAGAARRGGAV